MKITVVLVVAAALVACTETPAASLSEGPPGPNGADGQTGAAGLQGAKGDPGDPGPAGDAGPQGPPGIQGEPGQVLVVLVDDGGSVTFDGGIAIVAGPAGPQGQQGPPGTNGASGDAGAKGDTGDQGLQGAPGVPGAPSIVLRHADGGVYGVGAPGLIWTAAFGCYVPFDLGGPKRPDTFVNVRWSLPNCLGSPYFADYADSHDPNLPLRCAVGHGTHPTFGTRASYVLRMKQPITPTSATVWSTWGGTCTIDPGACCTTFGSPITGNHYALEEVPDTAFDAVGPYTIGLE